MKAVVENMRLEAFQADDKTTSTVIRKLEINRAAEKCQEEI